MLPKDISALSMLFVVAPYDNHLILFTIHRTEQAKKLREKTFNGLKTNQ